MTGEDLDRLQDLIERSNDSDTKELARAAIHAVLEGIANAERRKEEAAYRERTRFQIGIVVSIVLLIVLIPLVAMRVIPLGAVEIGTVLLAMLNFTTGLTWARSRKGD